MLVDAHKWWIVLCLRSARTAVSVLFRKLLILTDTYQRLWPFVFLPDISMTLLIFYSTCCMADRMVQLARTGHRCTFNRLRHGRNDLSCRINTEPQFRPTAVPGLSTHYTHHAYARLHQQHANQMDRKFQRVGFYFQHDRFAHRHHLNSRRDQ